MKYSGPEVNSMTHLSNSKGLSARTNRVKLRNLLAAVEGADLLKATQLKVIFNMLFEYHGFEMSWSDIVRFKFTSFPRQGKSVYVFSEARYMIGVLLHLSQLRLRTLSLNMLES